MKYLTLKEVMEQGIEFAGDVCYSGEYGQQVYTKESYERGIPVDGILYEKYQNGMLNYYCFYKNGIANGEQVEFYETSSFMKNNNGQQIRKVLSHGIKTRAKE